MKRSLAPIIFAAMLVPMAHAQISPGELVAPKMEISDGNLNFIVQPSFSDRNYQLQCSDSMASGTWTDVGVVRSGDGDNIVISTPYIEGAPKRFYRIKLVKATPTPAGFSLISAGSFQMGDSLDGLSNAPEHSVYVSEFYIGRYEVTKELWDEVRDWGLNNGYTDLLVGNGGYASKGTNHPVHSITWYAIMKWCNARSEKENLVPCYTVSGSTYKTGSISPDCNWSANGYRLPTEAEWEKAARGGMSGKRFPWGDTITHSHANYYSSSTYAYDVSPTRGYHPTYAVAGFPYSSSVGSFSPNEYGLYEMAGNMWEWCWDYYEANFYSDATAGTNPRGPASGSLRVYRGGGWFGVARYCRVANRGIFDPGLTNHSIGFRVVRSLVP